MTQENTEAPMRPVEFLVLAALKNEPLHGYEIVTRIGHLTSGRVRIRAGDLYRVLHRMSRRGLLRSVAGPDSAQEKRRNYYGITDLGRTSLESEAEMLALVAGQILETA